MYAEIQFCLGCGQGDFWLIERGRSLGTGTCCSLECLNIEQVRLALSGSSRQGQLQADQNEQRLSGSQYDDVHEWPHPQDE